MNGERRLVFVLPLMPRSVCADWDAAQANLRRTIGSIRAADPGGSALVVVACHDEPELTASDPAVHLLRVPFAVPGDDPMDGGRDKARKRRFAGAWLRKQVGADDFYVMFLDADDLVHRDLAAYVLAENQGSYVVDQGYDFDARAGVLWRVRDGFHRHCGSSFVCAFHADELPTSWEDDESPFGRFGARPDQRGHQEYDLLAAELGRPPAPVPFPAVIYVANHSESLSTRDFGGRRRAGAGRDVVWPHESQVILRDEFAAADLARSVAAGSRTARAVMRAELTRARAGVARRVLRKLR